MFNQSFIEYENVRSSSCIHLGSVWDLSFRSGADSYWVFFIGLTLLCFSGLFSDFSPFTVSFDDVDRPTFISKCTFRIFLGGWQAVSLVFKPPSLPPPQIFSVISDTSCHTPYLFFKNTNCVTPSSILV